ncbi:MAG: DUF92 domain-containing protein [Candidatus Marinimicrobia bacterium]|nr:DUF92 domain-containing protein [Candidatus Neomarinimicrobiota bacterium]MDD5581755.1 DUF92 domain-containing protein [Candidatus Neomarinimicrobiota bacterium]
MFANGGIAMIATLSFYFTNNRMWYVVFLGSIAAANADTWATELGTFSSRSPRSILTFKKVPMGTSGGISFIGTLGAFMGSISVVFLGWLMWGWRQMDFFTGGKIFLLFPLRAF